MFNIQPCKYPLLFSFFNVFCCVNCFLTFVYKSFNFSIIFAASNGFLYLFILPAPADTFDFYMISVSARTQPARNRSAL